MESGSLRSIELVQNHTVEGFEEQNKIVPVKKVVVHKVVSAPTGKRAFDLLERAKDYAKANNFDEMQIRFRKKSTDQYLSPRFTTDISDARDAIYSRFEVLPRFSSPLEQCPSAIVNRVRTQMMPLFGKRELWK